MSPHCRRHPPLYHLLHLLLLLFIIISLFHRLLLTLMRPFPSSRIDSPFRPPGHEPPLFPPAPSLSFSLSFVFFPFKYICTSLYLPLAISLFSCVYSSLSPSCFLSASRSSPLYYLPRAIYPSIHLPIRAHVHARIRARTYPSRSVDRSFSLSLFFFPPVSLSLSHGAPPRGSSSSS